MINGRSHITVMVLDLVRDSITCKLRQAEGDPMWREGGGRRREGERKGKREREEGGGEGEGGRTGRNGERGWRKEWEGGRRGERKGEIRVHGGEECGERREGEGDPEWEGGMGGEKEGGGGEGGNTGVILMAIIMMYSTYWCRVQRHLPAGVCSNLGYTHTQCC